MTRHIRMLPALLLLTAALTLGGASTVPLGGQKRLSQPFPVAALFFELNHTAGDLGIHAEIDGGPWTSLEVEGPGERKLLSIVSKSRLRTQGLTPEMSELYQSDKAEVGRMLGGDEAAFGHFFDTYFPRLYRFAITRLGNNADAAEEVVQATLCKAMTKLATYRGEAALFTWLCTFCRHEISANYARHQRTAHEIPLMEDTPDVQAALESLAAASADRPDEHLRRGELATLVRVTLDSLPDRYGDALEWKYLEELSVQDIAARLNVGPKAAESLLTRARQAFRDGFAAMHAGAEAWER